MYDTYPLVISLILYNKNIAHKIIMLILQKEFATKDEEIKKLHLNITHLQANEVKLKDNFEVIVPFLLWPRTFSDSPTPLPRLLVQGEKIYINKPVYVS